MTTSNLEAAAGRPEPGANEVGAPSVAVAHTPDQAQSLWHRPPSEIDLTVQVAREQVTESELEAAVARIHWAMGQAGAMSHVGGSLNWLANSRTRKVHVSIVTRDGRTTIQAHEKLIPLAGAIYGAAVGGVGVFGLGWTGFIIGINTLHSLPIALGLWGTLVAASWGAARMIYSKLVARRQRQLGALVADIGQGLQDRTLLPESLSIPPTTRSDPTAHPHN